MRTKIIILIGILLLVGAGVCGYWYLQLRTSEDPIPESGIFVMADPSPDSDVRPMEDAPCRHSI